MRLISSVLGALALAPAIFSTAAVADVPASTFYESFTGSTFSVNVPSNSSDLYIYFSSPSFSWVGVGIGSQMAGSLMFIMYSTTDGKDVTLSPRIGTGHTEPAFSKDIDIDILDGTSIQNNTFILNAVCHNCRTWQGGSLDVTSDTQPWIFAYGPDMQLESDSSSVSLRRHSHFAHFTMDMVQATGDGGVPAATTAMSGAELVGKLNKDSDMAAIVHTFFFLFAILILLPFKVTTSGFWPESLFNVITSVFFFIIVAAGFGTGLYVSKEYLSTKNYNSPHQLLGLIIFVFFAALFFQGLFTHFRRPHEFRKAKNQDENLQTAPGVLRHYSRTKSAHSWFGRFAWLLAIVDGGLGLKLSNEPLHILIIYVIVTVAIALALVTVYGCIIYRRRRLRRKAEDPRENSEIILENYWGAPHSH